MMLSRKLVEFIMNMKHGSIGGVRDLTLKKVQASPRLKELKSSVAANFLLRHMLNLLPTKMIVYLMN